MSLEELTRNSFQSGISANKWLRLCRLFIDKNNIDPVFNDPGPAICTSILKLFESYPGDPTLQEYLRHAIRDGLLVLSVFVGMFLDAAQSQSLHNSATLDMLCRLALDAHYSSGLPTVGSVVPYDESQISIFATIQNALVLLRTAYSLPISHFHQLTTSASELLLLLLPCATDMSRVSNSQLSVIYNEAATILHSLHLLPILQQQLTWFMSQLRGALDDGAKQQREAQTFHDIQMITPSKGVVGVTSEDDIVTCSMMLHHLVLHRAGEFGSGATLCATAILVQTFKSTSWTPPIFYRQLLLSTITCLSQYAISDKRSSLIWRAFMIGRLPHLLVSFEKALEPDAKDDWRLAMHTALHSISQRSDLLTQCEHIMFSYLEGLDPIPEQTDPPGSLFRSLLQNLVATGLIDQSFALSIDTSLANNVPSSMQLEAQEANLDLEQYLESRLSPEVSLDDTLACIERIRRDFLSHAHFAEVVRKQFVSLTSTFDVEALSHLSKALYLHESATELVSLHAPIAKILIHTVKFLDDYDCETLGDPQSAVSHLGDVVLFIQTTIARFHLTTKPPVWGDVGARAQYLYSITKIYEIEELSADDASAFHAWFKALFDSSSEGIEDSCLRSTRPKTLLRLTPSLFSHAITAHLDNRLDRDTLNNGVSYFLGPLLNWTLVGVIKSLLELILRRGSAGSHVHLEVIHTLVSSPSCPQPVLSLCSANVMRLFSNPTCQEIAQTRGIDVKAVISIAHQASGLHENASLPATHRTVWMDQPRQAIGQAILMARTGKASVLDVDRCLIIMSPPKFLHLLWSELIVSAPAGMMETCERIATHVLTTPRSAGTPPLLPIFLQMVLPSLISSIDNQGLQEQAISVELLVSIVATALTSALNLEQALHTVCKEERPVLGQTTTILTRKLAMDLRRRRDSAAAGAITHQLATSVPFVTNFPTFVTELQL